MCVTTTRRVGRKKSNAPVSSNDESILFLRAIGVYYLACAAFLHSIPRAVYIYAFVVRARGRVTIVSRARVNLTFRREKPKNWFNVSAAKKQNDNFCALRNRAFKVRA